MNESDLQKVCNCKIYPRDSKIISVRGFVNIQDGSLVGSHWTCFKNENNKSFHFDTFGGQPDKFLLNQLPKPITNRN